MTARISVLAPFFDQGRDGALMTSTRYIRWTLLLALHARVALAQAPAAEPEAESALEKEPDARAHYETVVRSDPDQDSAVRSSDATARLTRKRAGFVTVIDASRSEGEMTSLAEQLDLAVGVSVRSLGGLGAFSSVSIRGAAAAQVTVMLDGVPLSRDASAGVDLGDLALETLDHVEVYRGAVPLELGGGLGGALNLVTRPEDGTGKTRDVASASLGSFGARRVLLARRAGGRSDDPGSAIAASLVYGGARGDFPYFDDHGTPFELSDDAVRLRRGNDYDQLDASLRLRLARCAQPEAACAGQLARAEIGLRAFYKDQGVPATSSLPGVGARLTTSRLTHDFRVERAADRPGTPSLRLSGYSLAQREHYDDRSGRVGLGNQDQRYTTLSGGLRAELGWSGARQQLTVLPEARFEWFTQEDLAAGGTRGGGRRFSLALAAREQLFAFGDRLLLEAGLRADVLLSRASEGSLPRPPFDPRPLSQNQSAYLSPRGGARLRLTSNLFAKTNLGRYVRAPSFLELYGDRGSAIGNSQLRVERGLSGDVGLVLAPPPRGGALDRLYVESVYFHSRPEDTIVFVPSGHVAVAQNLGAAVLAGVELAVSLRLYRSLTLASNYTYLDAHSQGPPATYAGKRLPGRPTHELHGRIDWARSLGPSARRRGISLAYDIAILSGDYLDAANFNPAPTRVLHGLSLGVRPQQGWRLVLDIKNLADLRQATVASHPLQSPDLPRIPVAVSDVMGQPLPGRALFLTLSYAR